MIRGLLLSTAALLLASCGFELAGGSSSTETGDKVSLSGQVTGAGGEPISGVIVSLAKTGIADTTDILGEYALTGEVSDTLGSDTLFFDLDGHVLARVRVTQWIDTLPVVHIVQRDFSGILSVGNAVIAHIEGVLTGDGIAAGDSVVATFFYNALASNYSGFLYFPPQSAGERHYTVHINVYDVHGVRTGRSRDVPFSSFAGNITIPPFRAENLVTPPSKVAP